MESKVKENGERLKKLTFFDFIIIIICIYLLINVVNDSLFHKTGAT